jgi:hypothetical protein
VSQIDASRDEAPRLEPAEFNLQEGESVRVDLVVGDERLPLIVEMRPGGQLKMGLVDPDQAWYWTEQWQAGEREADADIAAGRREIYEDADDFLRSFGT